MAPEQREEMDRFIQEQGMRFEVYIEDIQDLIDAESRSQETARMSRQGKQQPSMDWESYHPLEDIYEWFDYLEGTKMQLIIRFFS